MKIVSIKERVDGLQSTRKFLLGTDIILCVGLSALGRHAHIEFENMNTQKNFFLDLRRFVRIASKLTAHKGY